jgi:hypothetical protein
MIVNAGLRRFISGGKVSFQPSFADNGDGTANIGLITGSGAGTYTGATPKWTKLVTGLWASVPANNPRYCHFSDSNICNTLVASARSGGYFAEQASTQLVTPTASIRDMTDASWVKTTMTATKTATGIDGVVNSATRLTATGANALILQTLVAVASTRTYSCWIRRITGTGAIELTQDGVTFTNIAPSLNTSYSVQVQLKASQLNAVYGLRIGTNGDVIDVDFNQFEAGNVATSPIDTAGATRAADALTYPAAGNVDITQGTCYAELASLLPVAEGVGANRLIGIGITGADVLSVFTGNASTTISTNDATTVVTKSGLTNLYAGIRKRAVSWGVAGRSITGDGAVVASGAFDGSMGATTIGIGNAGSGTLQWNGIIKTVQISRTQLSDSALQNKTA